MLKVIFFDFNGVIINDEAIHKSLIDEILLGENLKTATDAEYQQYCLGRSDRSSLQAILEHRGRLLAEEYLTKLLVKKAQQYNQWIAQQDSLPIYEGLNDLLLQIQERGLKIGLVTGALRSEVELVLDKLQLNHYFSVIVTGEDVKAGKPQPDSYLLGIERFNQLDTHLQLTPGNCLAIEDTFAGIQSAKSAGIQVVGIAHTYPFHFMQRHANWAIDYFSELDLERVMENLACRM